MERCGTCGRYYVDLRGITWLLMLFANVNAVLSCRATRCFSLAKPRAFAPTALPHTGPTRVPHGSTRVPHGSHTGPTPSGDRSNSKRATAGVVSSTKWAYWVYWAKHFTKSNWTIKENLETVHVSRFSFNFQFLFLNSSEGLASDG